MGLAVKMISDVRLPLGPAAAAMAVSHYGASRCAPLCFTLHNRACSSCHDDMACKMLRLAVPLCYCTVCVVIIGTVVVTAMTTVETTCWRDPSRPTTFFDLQ